MARILATCAAALRNLDAAVAASRLLGPAVLFSAHGNGFGVRGSLMAAPSAFIGLTYRYPGFVSTTSDPAFCDAFLAKRRTTASRPTMLEIGLPDGFPGVDIRHGGHAGEAEILLGRDIPFLVVDADIVDGDVLWLVLEPQTAAGAVSQELG